MQVLAISNSYGLAMDTFLRYRENIRFADIDIPVACYSLAAKWIIAARGS